MFTESVPDQESKRSSESCSAWGMNSGPFVVAELAALMLRTLGVMGSNPGQQSSCINAVITGVVIIPADKTRDIHYWLPWLRHFVTRCSVRKHQFIPRPVHLHISFPLSVFFHESTVLLWVSLTLTVRSRQVTLIKWNKYSRLAFGV
jgi:hypothetical protein